jgi:hypothetical protein
LIYVNEFDPRALKHEKLFCFVDFWGVSARKSTPHEH